MRRLDVTDRFKPGRNCWRLSQASHVRVLIDCADYYRAVFDAVLNSKHSIFIIGWEIDSGIELLRGQEAAEAKVPSALVELLSWKAEQNPQIRIYVLRWDSSIAFFGEREIMAGWAWTINTPENIHVCLDSSVPIGGSHHQKIVIVDDEIAFSGGMDIARQRWDDRDHRLNNPFRRDVSGEYDPYHDVQVLLQGPVVNDLAELVRERWFTAARYEAIPVRGVNVEAKDISSIWPTRFPPTMINIRCAIARTVPPFSGRTAAYEVKQLYLDLINAAERFIFIESQFLTSLEIASALNRRLKAVPDLKALIISSNKPKGFFEREGMWRGRVEFKKALMDGVGAAKVRMVCSGRKNEKGGITFKRIHSKILAIDEKYLNIGSANLNNRSMSLDSECDVVFIADRAEHSRWIAQIRNELLAEHSGYSMEAVDRLIAGGYDLNAFFRSADENYRLYNIHDSLFSRQNLKSLAQGLVRSFVDPVRPRWMLAFRNPPRWRTVFYTLFVVVFAAALLVIYNQTDWFEAANIRKFLLAARSSDYSLLLTCLVFMVGGFVFFPVTALSLLTAAVFGAIWGPVYAMCGALTSAAAMYGVGHMAGVKGLRSLFGSRVRTMDEHFRKAGVLGVAMLRFTPIAPFSLVNLAAGVSSVRFIDYMAGTFIGFLPGFLAKGIFADSLAKTLLDPASDTRSSLFAGLALWILLAGISYYLARRQQERKRRR